MLVIWLASMPVLCISTWFENLYAIHHGTIFFLIVTVYFYSKSYQSYLKTKFISVLCSYKKLIVKKLYLKTIKYRPTRNV